VLPSDGGDLPQPETERRSELIINKLKRCGCLPMSASTLASEADPSKRLSRTITMFYANSFPEVRQTNYDLRPRAHKFKLPIKVQRNFIPRLLYKDMYM